MSKLSSVVLRIF